MARRREPRDQLAFDIDGMIHEAEVAAAPPWAGPAPLHFTVDYYTPAELEAAWQHAVFLDGHSASRRRMWHPGSPIDPHGEANGHRLVSFSVDLRCLWWEHGEDEAGERIRCTCVGDLLTQGICEPCAWNVVGSEAHVVEAWHDHTWPGWRELPVLPHGLRTRDDRGRFAPKTMAWLEAHYPPAWQVEGAPIITDRGGPLGTRHVPGYSPWGGYDISHTALGILPEPAAGGAPAPPLATPASRAPRSRKPAGRALGD